MNEPRRWLDISRALSAAERRVLVAGQTAPVPVGPKAAVKAALLAQLAAPATVAPAKAASLSPTARATATLSVVRATWLKFTAAGFALGLVGSAVASASLSEQRVQPALRTAPPARASSRPRADTIPSVGRRISSSKALRARRA
jgi:hypothetical protein